MSIQHDNFIGIYRDVFPEGFCRHLIDDFERLASAGAGSNRLNSEGAHAHVKNDHQLIVDARAHNLLSFNGVDTQDMFFEGLQKCYEDYVTRYSVLLNDSVRCTHFKMQRTQPGGGYHVWHAEQSSGRYAQRALAYILYLNTLADDAAGETEFLYQRKRVAPAENTLVIWPAAFTHAHRGNVVHGNDSKYIVTGWFYYDA